MTAAAPLRPAIRVGSITPVAIHTTGHNAAVISSLLVATIRRKATEFDQPTPDGAPRELIARSAAVIWSALGDVDPDAADRLAATTADPRTWSDTGTRP